VVSQLVDLSYLPSPILCVLLAFALCFPFLLASNFIAILAPTLSTFAFNFLGSRSPSIIYSFLCYTRVFFHIRPCAALAFIAFAFQFYAAFRAVFTHLQPHQSFDLYPSVTFPLYLQSILPCAEIRSQGPDNWIRFIVDYIGRALSSTCCMFNSWKVNGRELGI
jgi:hypothetical protein